MHRAVALLSALALPAATVAAQALAGGALHGTVRDDQGAPIGHAQVGIRGTTLFTRTDGSGRYRLAAMPTGTLHVRVDAVGYAGLDTAITIAPAESVTLDARLTFSPLTLPPVSTVIEKLPHFGERPATSVAEVSEHDLDLIGRYRLAAMPTGTLHVRVDAVGYAGLDTAITIAPAESVTLDARLTFSPLTLPPVSTVIEKLPHFGERPATSVAEVSEHDLD